MATVQMFIDYQNVHLTAHYVFAPPGTPVHETLLHPLYLAETIMTKRSRPHDELTDVHVYRGQPSSQHEPVLSAATKAQAAHWSRDRRVRLHLRSIRYPSDWPKKPAREKGVDVHLAIDFARAALAGAADVLILVSRDSDLVPALELAAELGKVSVESAGWVGCSRLRLPGHEMPYTVLSGREFVEARDRRPYGPATPNS